MPLPVPRGMTAAGGFGKIPISLHTAASQSLLKAVACVYLPKLQAAQETLLPSATARAIHWCDDLYSITSPNDCNKGCDSSCGLGLADANLCIQCTS